MAFSLKDYEIIEEIGQGGFGTILKARQKSLGRIVAIKLLSTQRTQKQSEIMRFRREAESMAVLSHDNIISVFDYAYYGNNYYIVMEFIDGITFDNALTNGIPVDLSLVIMEKVISGLKVAHGEHIIHRDIKPSNILLGRQGQVKLADFGLATFQPDITQLSSADAVIGTFSYMAPEAMVTPKEVDARVDIFSLGCVLYQVLSGRVPFSGTSIGDVSYNIINQEPGPIPVDNRLRDLGEITTQCLNKNRDKRPGLDTVHAALRDTIGENYHTSSEALQGFVDRGKKKADPTKLSTMEFKKKSDTKKSTPYLVVGASVVACIVIIMLIRRLFSPGPPQDEPLPTIAALNDSPALSTPSSSSSGGQTRQLSPDGPKPVTSTSPGQARGTLVLAGMMQEDSVTVNDSAVTGRVKRGKQQITLEQGHYRVVVYRQGQKKIERKVRVMPYQILTLDLAKEQ